MVRITVNGETAPFSLKAEAKPEDWDTQAGRLRHPLLRFDMWQLHLF